MILLPRNKRPDQHYLMLVLHCFECLTKGFGIQDCITCRRICKILESRIESLAGGSVWVLISQYPEVWQVFTVKYCQSKERKGGLLLSPQRLEKLHAPFTIYIVCILVRLKQKR